MVTDTETDNYGFVLPTRGKEPKQTVDEAIDLLIAAWVMLDGILFGVDQLAGSKANAGHTHSLAQVTGLIDALAGKMPASTTFRLADLIDVTGADEAPAGYLLVKAAGIWQVMSAAAAIGNHQHGVADIVGLNATISSAISSLVASAPTTLDTLQELAAAIGNDPNFAVTFTNLLNGKEPANANLLKANLTATLSKGFLHSPMEVNGGTISSGSVALSIANGHYQNYQNGGAHTLVAPTEPFGSMSLRIVNTASAGVVTVTGAKIIGDALNTTNGKAFHLLFNNNYDKVVTVVAVNS